MNEDEFMNGNDLEKPEYEGESENPLTDRQRLFIEYYLQSWNATDAARKAGYADPEVSGWQNKQKLVIKNEISKRIAAVCMDSDECLMRLGKFARGSLEPFLTESDGELWPDLKSRDAKKNFDLLKKIKPKKRSGGKDEERWTETEVELEIHDPMKALELIGRHHKLFTDKTEHSGLIQTEDVNLSDTERLERLMALSDTARARRDGKPPVGDSGNNEG